MRTMTGCLAAVLLLACAHAGAAESVCDKVLEGELFNRVLHSDSSTHSSRQALRTYMMQSSDEKAYDIYESLLESAKQQQQKGSGSFDYFVAISADLDIDINYSNKLSKSEFSKKFEQAKRRWMSETGMTSEDNGALSSAYASYVRDPDSIDAWKACVTREREAGLYAFGSRDDDGTPYVNVVWAPGAFAGVAPSISVELVHPGDGILLDADRADVAPGSGRTFRVGVLDPARGFSIRVNGSLRGQDGREAGSFSAAALIPPALPAAGESSRRFSLLGKWALVDAPENSATFDVYRDDGETVIGTLVQNVFFHQASGHYVGSDRVVFTTLRHDNTTGCELTTQQEIQFIDADNIVATSAPWPAGCDLTAPTPAVATRWRRTAR
jgi:hypothetical protein